MFDRNRSGQIIPFAMVSALSGNAVTGISAAISGRVTLDGGSQTVVEGTIDEPGGGQYRLIPFAADLDGNVCGFYFTSSGCVPVSIGVVTQQNVSGKLYPASGQTYIASGPFANVPINTLSGVVANSGLTVTVIKSLLSGVVANSGLTVTVIRDNLSGLVVNSGLFATVPIATISGVVANSGLNVEANVARWLAKIPKPLVASGHVDAFPSLLAGTVVSGTATTIQLNGAPTGTSGIFDGAIISLVEGLAAGQSRVIRNFGSSGIALIDPPWEVVPETTEFYIITPTTRTASGVDFPSLPKAALSGLVANSGLFTTVLPANLSGVVVNSGLFVTLPKETISGVVANSGLTVTVIRDNLSGLMVNSGLFVTLPKETISGVIANSGLFVTATAEVDPATISGVFATVPKETISGVIANSGLFVTATAEVGSGVLYLASGSIFRETYASGVIGASGGFLQAWGDSGSATVGINLDKSGYTATSLSGTTYIASGPFVNVPISTLSGVVANSGLTVTVIRNNLSGLVVNSGLFVTLPKETISGVVANSGLFVTAAVSVDPATISGVFATVPKETLSGVVANSGLTVTVIKDTLSGIIANSGLTTTVIPATISGTFVSVPTDTISGVFATVPPETLSGVVANSGLTVSVVKATLSGVIANSGLFVSLPKETISGVVANSGLFVVAEVSATVASGSLYLASGSLFVNTFASGTLDSTAGVILSKSVSGMEPDLPANSLGAVVLKQTSRFYAPSGYTYYTDGTTVFMIQQVVTTTSQSPIIELGVAEKQ